MSDGSGSAATPRKVNVTSRDLLIERLIERGDRRSLAALELMRPFPMAQRVKNALYHWTKP